ncbi:hypothetical protein IAR50_001230 [Cryptococcus sp. DSM 104548]
MSTADNELRCNNLKCRACLATEGQAVLTTCSHIFCVACATSLFSNSLICPACSQSLQASQSEAHGQMTTLNPTNEYKASILAGLPPHTVMEIAARALSFWTYQLSQESAFQALILKNTQERQNHLEKQLNNAFVDLQLLESDLEAGRRKMQESVNELRRKDRELSKLRDDFGKIKRKTVFSHVAHGAEMADTPMAALRSSRNKSQANHTILTSLAKHR